MTTTFDYIACRPDASWDWDDSEPYVVLKNGGTIAHWNEVKQIVVAIADQGLPLFDVLVILLAACDKSEFSKPAERISEHFQEVCGGDVSNSLDVLFMLQDLDVKYKTGDQRLLMLATILKRAHITLRLAVSKHIAKDLRSDEENEIFIDRAGVASRNHQSRVLNCLRILGNHFSTEESIVEAMAEYDFDALQRLDLDFPDTDKANGESESLSLEEQLLDDIRTNKLAQLIPHVLAGLNFPIVAKKSDDRPEGGVSDLANKGHFDQLVVTEYAYPDDMFASRIVNNEALFVQREKAKDDHNENYCILIDASLYNWGVPKFIGCAIACCVGIRNPEAMLSTFMVGDDWRQTNFRTKEGVVQALKITSADINPSVGLLDFMVRDGDYSSVMLITTRKSLNQTPMTEFRNAHGNKLDFIATISENAEVQVNRLKGKEVANFQLNLDKIWSKKAQEPKITHQVEDYSDTFPPVRVPIRTDDIYRSTRYRDTFYCVGKNKYLIRADWEDVSRYNGKAGVLVKQLYHPLDFMSEVGINPRGEKELLFFSEGKRTVFIHNLRSGEVREYHFIQWKHARNLGGYFMHDGESFIFALEQGYYRFDGKFDPKMDWSTEKTFNLPSDEELNKPKIRISTSWNYYKNIKRCGINRDKVLYLGRRAILTTKFESQTHIEFEGTPYLGGLIWANDQRLGKDRVFTFLDGSKIYSYSYGVLKFSFPENSEQVGYEIYLKNPGANKLQTTKAINLRSPKGLRESKEMIDQGSGTITFVSNMQKAKEVHGELSFAGADVEIKKVPLESSFYMVPLVDNFPVFASDKFFSGRDEFRLEHAEKQREIKSADFYNLYFKRFIEQILAHEA